jgi:hypothetical protein
MATYLEWPASGQVGYTFTPKSGSLKPINQMFDGRYSEWFAARVNTLPTTDGSMPVKMTRRGKQEWGSVNPDQPNQWAIAETGLGQSTGALNAGCSSRDANCPMGTSSSTVAFLQADFVGAFASHLSGTTTSRDGTIFPDRIPAQVNGVLADQVYMGPHRSTGPSPTGLGQRGFAAVDSLLWLKGGNVLASEDSYGPGGFNMGIMYNIASRKSVPIVGAISRYGITMGKMNAAAMAPCAQRCPTALTLNASPRLLSLFAAERRPHATSDIHARRYGSFSGSTDQEMTGFFDASSALTLTVPYTAQQWYAALARLLKPSTRKRRSFPQPQAHPFPHASPPVALLQVRRHGCPPHHREQPDEGQRRSDARGLLLFGPDALP